MVLAAAVLAAVASACGANESASPGAPSTTAAAATTTATTTTELPDLSASGLTPAPGVPKPSATLPLPPPPSGGAESVPAAVLDAVRADAASRLGVAAAAVEVLSGASREWSDGSLGCPKPGESYLQVITEGYQVIVSANGQTLDYRTSVNGAIKVC